jgi:hypothetical protein
MDLAKAAEATVNEIQNVALMSGGVLLVAAAVYVAVRLRRTPGVVLLCAGLAIAALGPLAMFADLLFDLSRAAGALSLLVLGLLEITAAVMIILAVPYLLRARQVRPVEVEGTA